MYKEYCTIKYPTTIGTRIEILGYIFIILIILLNELSYINVILLVILIKIRIYIIFVKLLFLLKKRNRFFQICYNLKLINIYIYNFN